MGAAGVGRRRCHRATDCGTPVLCTHLLDFANRGYSNAPHSVVLVFKLAVDGSIGPSTCGMLICFSYQRDASTHFVRGSYPNSCRRTPDIVAGHRVRAFGGWQLGTFIEARLMKSTLFRGPLMWIVLFATNNLVHAQDLTVTALVRVDAKATGNMTDIDTDNEFDSADSIANAFTLTFVEAASGNSHVGSFAEGKVFSTYGDLSLKGQAGVVGNGVRGSSSGQSEVYMAASQRDVAKFNTFRYPTGRELIVISRVKIAGGFDGRATFAAAGPPPAPVFDTIGSATGQMELGALFGGFVADPDTLQPIGPLLAMKQFCGKNCEFNMLPPKQVFLVLRTLNGQGAPLGYSMSMTMKAQGSSPVETVITGDFSGSVHWDGVVSVKDVLTGDLIDDWTVTSLSGFDYSKPFTFDVPEPTGIALIMILSCTLFTVRRRRIATK